MTEPEDDTRLLPPAKRTRWTFDEPCTTMEHTERSTPYFDIASSETQAADLIILGWWWWYEGDCANNMTSFDNVVRAIPEPSNQRGLALCRKELTNIDGTAAPFKAGMTTPVIRLVDENTLTTKRFALMGLGKKDHEGLGRTIGSTLASMADQEKGCKSCLVYLPNDILSSDAFLRDCTASFFVALYSDNRYRTGSHLKWPAVGMMHLYFAPLLLAIPGEQEASPWDRDTFASIVKEGMHMARGQYLAMDIVNAPHNVLNSVSLANEAIDLAAKSNHLVCKILNKQDCELRGMGAYLAVARGSETPPKFIHLTYTPPGTGVIQRKVGIVGKGLLFDTGGYNIKVNAMELMKFDCGGAAAVLGAAKAIDGLEIPGVQVHFIIAACENMISAKAYVPSDVLVASNGKTIEVVNTDAEGRLTLADALVYADKEVGCDKIIELSTLTGACMAALGKSVCGVWTNNDELAAELDAASKITGEKSWRMPMVTEYNEQLDSKIADITNCGTRFGGAITAALFLQNFIEGDKPFSHIDIAGPVWNDKKGATGFGVKLITEWCKQQGA